MNMPGFTAEDSLYPTSGRYRMTPQSRDQCEFGSTIGRYLPRWAIYLLRRGNGYGLHQLLSASSRIATGRARLRPVQKWATALRNTGSGFSDGTLQ